MKIEDFEKEHCSVCGSQRCTGITSDKFFMGCKDFQREIFEKFQKLSSTEKAACLMAMAFKMPFEEVCNEFKKMGIDLDKGNQ